MLQSDPVRGGNSFQSDDEEDTSRRTRSLLSECDDDDSFHRTSSFPRSTSSFFLPAEDEHEFGQFNPTVGHRFSRQHPFDDDSSRGGCSPLVRSFQCLSTEGKGANSPESPSGSHSRSSSEGSISADSFMGSLGSPVIRALIAPFDAPPRLSRKLSDQFSPVVQNRAARSDKKPVARRLPTEMVGSPAPRTIFTLERKDRSFDSPVRLPLRRIDNLAVPADAHELSPLGYDFRNPTRPPYVGVHEQIPESACSLSFVEPDFGLQPDQEKLGSPSLRGAPLTHRSVLPSPPVTTCLTRRAVLCKKDLASYGFLDSPLDSSLTPTAPKNAVAPQRPPKKRASIVSPRRSLLSSPQQGPAESRKLVPDLEPGDRTSVMSSPVISPRRDRKVPRRLDPQPQPQGEMSSLPPQCPRPPRDSGIERERCQAMTDTMAKHGIKLVCLDWDLTVISLHTRSKWTSTPWELARWIRPIFRNFIEAAVGSNLRVAFVSFSGQHDLVEQAISLAFAAKRFRFVCDENFVVRCSDRRWRSEEARFARLFPGAKLSETSKLPHICSAASFFCDAEKENGGLVIRPHEIVFVDDDPDNVKDALNHDVLSVRMDPSQPDYFLTTLEQHFRKETRACIKSLPASTPLSLHLGTVD